MNREQRRERSRDTATRRRKSSLPATSPFFRPPRATHGNIPASLAFPSAMIQLFYAPLPLLLLSTFLSSSSVFLSRFFFSTAALRERERERESLSRQVEDDSVSSLCRLVFSRRASDISSRSSERNFSSPVVRQKYEVQVRDAYVLAGNTGMLRCEIPAFVKEYVAVTSWFQDSAFNIYPTAESGKCNYARATRPV